MNRHILNLTPGFEPFGPTTIGHVHTIDYPSGIEPHVRVPLGTTERTRLLVTARPQSPTDLLRVVFAGGAIAKQVGRADLFLPYLPHARQDRIAVPGDAPSLEQVVHMLEHAYTTIFSFDVHNPQAQGLSRVVNLSPLFFLNWCLNSQKALQHLYLVVPDAGMQKRLVNHIATIDASSNHELMSLPWLTCHKHRDPDSGTLEVNVPDVSLAGASCLIVDDICDGGGTFIPIAKRLKEQGANEVALAVSHGLFTKGIDHLVQGGIDRIYTTDSFKKQPAHERLVVWNKWTQMFAPTEQ